MDLKGSKTEQNLLTAFAGESQARNRYTYYASQAKKEGFVQIAAAFPAGVIGSTHENLQEAAAGEDYETTEMYPEFAKVAEEEGFKEIAGVFRSIAVAEARHRDRYLALDRNVVGGTVFKKDKPVRWVCRNCGYVHEGPEAPSKCPACAHPQAHFELEAANY